jgi:large subunit ribosomal protein L17
MRHRNRRGKLARPSAHRSALLRNMVTSLLEHELIETTDAKAKEVRRVADRMITLGKRGSLHARRQAASVIRDGAIVAKLFSGLAERYQARPGGYTRVLKSRVRVGDAAPLSIVELVDRPAGKAEAKPPEEKPAEKKRSAKKAPEKKAPEKKARAKKAAEPAAEPKPRTRRKKAAG